MSKRRFSSADVKVSDVKISASETSSSTAPSETDWSRCLIRQEDKDEKLMFPSVKKGGAWLTTFVENLIQFGKLECLYFNLARLDKQKKLLNGTMLVFTTSTNWHIARLGYSGLKRENMLIVWKLDKSPKLTRKQKSFTESRSLCFFVEKITLQNNFMKPVL